MNLNRMQVFAAVIERGSFTAAAEALGLTKSMVSQHLNALEDELGVRLLHRTTRRLALTEAGTIYLEGCQRVAQEALTLTARLQRLKSEPEGALRVTTTVDYATSDFAAQIHSFAKLYPKISVHLLVRDGVVDLLDERIDVAIRLGWLRTSSLPAVKLATMEQMLVAAPAYLSSVAPIRSPADLEQVEVIALTLLRQPRKWTLKDAAGRPQTISTSGRLSADSPSTVRALTVAGAGVSLLGNHLVEHDLRAGRLVQVLPAYRMPTGGIYAVTPSRSARLPHVRALMEFLKASTRTQMSESHQRAQKPA